MKDEEIFTRGVVAGAFAMLAVAAFVWLVLYIIIFI